MEIIEEGKKIYKCPDCGCKFRLTSEKEIQRNNWKFVEDGFIITYQIRAYYDSVKCPQCGNEIIIKWR